MRRILLFIITYMMFISIVNAEEFSNWSEVKPTKDNLVIESETRYRYYLENQVGEYISINNAKNYTNLDNNNFVYTNYTNWDICKEVENNFETETKTIYPYQKTKMIQYIAIENVSENALLNTFNVFNKTNRIKTTLRDCHKCDPMFWTIDATGYMLFNINNKYNIENITFDITFNNTEIVYYDLVIYSDIYPFIKVAQINTNSSITHYQIDKNWLVDTAYDEIIFSDDLVLEDDFTIVLPREKQCRYREKLIYHYNVEKEYYSDEYYLNSPGEKYKKDENDYKVYYRYKEKPIIVDSKIKEVEPIYVEENIIDYEKINYLEKDIVTKELEVATKEIDIATKELEVATKESDISLINTLNLKEKNISMKFIITLVIFLLMISSLIVAKKLKKMSSE